MKEKLNELLREGREKILSAKNETELQDIKAAILGYAGRPDGAAEGGAQAGCFPAS